MKELKNLTVKKQQNKRLTINVIGFILKGWRVI
jgi:hypothetical protein